MAQLTKARPSLSLGDDAIDVLLAIGAKAAAKGYQGGIACVDSSGYLVRGSTATGLVAVGRIEDDFDNTAGSNGAISVLVRQGIFPFANSSSGDQITDADRGRICYIVDDQTVAKTSSAGTRSPAGRVHHVDSDGVWIEMRATYGRDLADRSVTGPIISPAAFKPLHFTGLNGAGAVTATGVKVGDKVLILTNLTDAGDGSGSFEGTITVANQLQQTDAANLTSKKYSALLLVQS